MEIYCWIHLQIGFCLNLSVDLDFRLRGSDSSGGVPKPFACLLKFKKINDQYGHAEGDRALINFTDLIIKTFRESDIYARLGGDEFVVLLTDTPLETVESILSRFDKEINQYNKTSLRGYNIRYSSGVAIYDPDKHQSIEDLLAEADTMMYQQKQSASSVL